ncbi:MAG: glutamate 5-kinase [Candidatus Diapherotrites archaeon]|nr:glutamate 5-kinase [Candidatus Diapherotrites archaeon]
MNPKKYNLIVVKVGTNTLMGGSGLKKEFFTELVSEAAELANAGKKIVIVSSGAIGLGKRKLKIAPKNIAEQQGLAAIGQVELMNEYVKRFETVGIEAAQILVSQHDLLNETCLSNLKNTLDFLFKHKVVPVVNENDVVAIEELRNDGMFSDNDALAALLAKQIGADLLVILTSKSGLVGRDGKIMPELKNFESVCDIGKSSMDGRGGINSKLSAIRTAVSSGCDVFVSGPDSFNGFSSGKAKGTFVSAES